MGRNRAEGRTWVPTTAAATHLHQIPQKVFLLLMDLFRQRPQDHFAHLVKVIQLILRTSKRVSATSPASYMVQWDRDRGSPTCWLSFICCSWRKRLAIWTDLTGYSWSI